MKLNKDLLSDVHERIKKYIHNTPVLTSQLLNNLTRCELYFKCENFQKMGAFKIRGAINALLNLTEEELQRGVVTHSSGNFAQALSLSAKLVGTKAYIVMPLTAPEVKKQAVIGYGGEITLCEPNLKSREETSDKIINEKGCTFVHPSNNINVILGQATVAKELLEEQPNLNFIIVPVGGGGLIAGTSLAANFFGKDCKTIGGEPFEADDAFRSLKSGKIEHNQTTNTIADGLKTELGNITFPIIQKYVNSIIRVEEDEIIEAMKLIWQRMKIIVEPFSSVSLAALIKEKEKFKNKKVGIILSGGNVDLINLPF
ncbi:MAG: serine dehydratase [Ignavibacteriales bacterium CG12_big_fil_rev_8_21_14_0_65_30_8]|nr:MAG: serine dehydratase [Ignavibacteriales bacterium CG12_big_fil_rev_8_21_14_0_65_30_8]